MLQTGLKKKSKKKQKFCVMSEVNGEGKKQKKMISTVSFHKWSILHVYNWVALALFFYFFFFISPSSWFLCVPGFPKEAFSSGGDKGVK